LCIIILRRKDTGHARPDKSHKIDKELNKMKFLHTSDWHLGASDAEQSLREDQIFFIDEICRIAGEEKVDAVIIAGDVYDRSVASAEATKLYDYAMTKLCKSMSTAVVTIAGNHDSAERLSNCRELLLSAGLHIAGELTANPHIVEFDGVNVYLLPWITEEKVKYVFPEEKENIASLDDAYRVVTDSFRKTFAPGKKNIIVSHSFVTGSETSKSDRAAEIGFAAQISASVFDGFDYVALGHIHKPQDIKVNIRYSGTPMPYSFGKEEKQTKSVTIVDTDTMEKKIVELPLLHRRATLEGTMEELLNPDCPEDVRNGYIRLVVTDSFVGLEALSEFRKIYPNLLEVCGRNYDKEDATISISVDDINRMQENPVEVFKFFCNDEIAETPSEHWIELFENAVKSVEEDI